MGIRNQLEGVVLASLIVAVALLSIGLGSLSLRVFGFPVGLVAIIGLLGMMGLAINDSIVVIAECQQAHLAKNVYISAEAAIASTDLSSDVADRVNQSTRHALTTSLTTVGGVLPLILAGGGFWPPMMTVVAGGITRATLLALAFTPATYLWIAPREPSLPCAEVRH